MALSDDGFWSNKALHANFKNDGYTASTLGNHYVRAIAGSLTEKSTNGFLAALFDHAAVVNDGNTDHVFGHIQLLSWIDSDKVDGSAIHLPSTDTCHTKDTIHDGYKHQLAWQEPDSKWAVDVHVKAQLEVRSPVFQIANMTNLYTVDELLSENGVHNVNRMKRSGTSFYPAICDTPRAQDADLVFWTVAVSFPLSIGQLALEEEAGKKTREQCPTTQVESTEVDRGGRDC